MSKISALIRNSFMLLATAAASAVIFFSGTKLLSPSYYFSETKLIIDRELAQSQFDQILSDAKSQSVYDRAKSLLSVEQDISLHEISDINGDRSLRQISLLAVDRQGRKAQSYAQALSQAAADQLRSDYGNSVLESQTDASIPQLVRADHSLRNAGMGAAAGFILMTMDLLWEHVRRRKMEKRNRDADESPFDEDVLQEPSAVASEMAEEPEKEAALARTEDPARIEMPAKVEELDAAEEDSPTENSDLGLEELLSSYPYPVLARIRAQKKGHLSRVRARAKREVDHAKTH